MDSIHVDRELWSVRAWKARSLAVEACRSGHVAVKQSYYDQVRPSQTLSPDDIPPAMTRGEPA
jgi:ribosomal 50S subunit-recycling heat shock protein